MKTKLCWLALCLGAAWPVSAQDWARAELEKSPRHMEWVTVTNGTRAVDCWVVYPEVKDKATAVLVIHDSSGVTDWARLAADELAAAGYIAIAPDFLSGTGPKGGGTSDFSGQSELVAALKKLPPAQITGDLNAAAVFVFYGFPPPPAGVTNIQCPVYGFYGENDARVTLTVPDGQAAMKRAGKTFEPVIYAGAGHGFMAHGEPGYPQATPADRQARDAAWERLKGLLKKI